MIILPLSATDALPATRDALLVIVGFGLVTHLIFKRWEPSAMLAHITLLLVLPAALSVLLVGRFSSKLLAIVVGFLTFYATLSTSIITYRLSPWHPLAHYPGPVMCKLSKFWMAYIAGKGKQHLYIQQLHEKYSDIVRIGPNEVSIRDPSAINPMMGSQGLPKGPTWGGRALHNPVKSIIVLQDQAEHLRRRQAWNRGLNTAAIKELAPVMTGRIVQLVEGVASQNGVVDLSQWISFFTYDFMGDMVFGGGSEMMRDGDPQGMWPKIETAMDFLMLFDHVPWLAHYAKKFPSSAEGYYNFRRIAVRRIEARRKGGAHARDLMYYITNEDVEESTPPLAQLIGDGILAIIAGSDTTATVLCNLFYLVIRHPDVYKRLQAEVDHYYPSGENSLDPKHFPEMNFMEAVINETLRLYPAVLSGSQRTALRGSGGKLLGSYYLPEGNQSRVHFYSVQRDPRNFTDPETFWPDRWLIAEGIRSSPEKIVHNTNAFIPFSHGPANCVGKQLAMQEMRTVVCHAMQKMDFRFADGWDPDNWLRDLGDSFVVKKGHLPVTVERRD